MGNITDRERLERLNTSIRKRTKVDKRGRTILPLKLRRKMGLRDGSSIVIWSECKRRKGQPNEFIIEVGVKP
jgi:bifunctional DNA-binding transcriptional regulator/antitoxin component of YhaV-PrlF toxin-antitoxin module